MYNWPDDEAIPGIRYNLLPYTGCTKQQGEYLLKVDTTLTRGIVLNKFAHMIDKIK
jgi:hypothetical protein